MLWRVKRKILYYINRKKFLRCDVDIAKVKIGPDYDRGFYIAHPENLKIGEGCVFNGNLYINADGGVKFGKYCHVARGLTVLSSNHNWRSETSLPYDSKIIRKPVSIGDAVWIGANVTILPGVRVADAAVISAGSVVIKDVGVGQVVGGNPAAEIAIRDIELTKKLLIEKKYY